MADNNFYNSLRVTWNVASSHIKTDKALLDMHGAVETAINGVFRACMVEDSFDAMHKHVNELNGKFDPASVLEKTAYEMACKAITDKEILNAVFGEQFVTAAKRER